MKMLILLVTFLIFSNCSGPYEHKFRKGDIVQFKLSGQKGMVVFIYRYHNTLEVRTQNGDKRIVKDFELEPYKNITEKDSTITSSVWGNY